MGELKDLLGLKVIGKCPFCGHDLVKWEHESAIIVECSNCMFRLVKLKGDLNRL